MDTAYPSTFPARRRRRFDVAACAPAGPDAGGGGATGARDREHFGTSLLASAWRTVVSPTEAGHWLVERARSLVHDFDNLKAGTPSR